MECQESEICLFGRLPPKIAKLEFGSGLVRILNLGTVTGVRPLVELFDVGLVSQQWLEYNVGYLKVAKQRQCLRTHCSPLPLPDQVYWSSSWKIVACLITYF